MVSEGDPRPRSWDGQPGFFRLVGVMLLCRQVPQYWRFKRRKVVNWAREEDNVPAAQREPVRKSIFFCEHGELPELLVFMFHLRFCWVTLLQNTVQPGIIGCRSYM